MNKEIYYLVYDLTKTSLGFQDNNYNLQRDLIAKTIAFHRCFLSSEYIDPLMYKADLCRSRYR